jgi:hypothetical protein
MVANWQDDPAAAIQEVEGGLEAALAVLALLLKIKARIVHRVCATVHL